MTERRSMVVLRSLLAAAAAALFIALAVSITGGFGFQIAGLPIRSHSPLPAGALAAILVAVIARYGRGMLEASLAWWWNVLDRYATPIAIVVSGVVVATALAWGTYVAGGSDSYCYLNQAELFARGRVHDIEPLATDTTWPGTPGAFVPAGHAAVPGVRGAMVPICPAGYPVLLTAARMVGGRPAMFWITPLMAGTVVLLAFLLGRRAAGPLTGLLSAVLTAASPPFLFQAMQPMSDVTATAAWGAALAAASRRGGTITSRAFLSGAFSACALAVRPNLLPLAPIVGLWFAFSQRPFSIRAVLRPLIVFGAALLPGVMFVLVMHNAMYGSPFRSGYGELSALFSTGNILPNLTRYPRWLVELHTPVIVLALLAPLLARGAEARRYALWLLAFAFAVFACYLSYLRFNEWWYLRLVLPGIVPLLALTAVVLSQGIERLPLPIRPVTFFAVASLLAIVFVTNGDRRGFLGSRDFEWRYRAAGEYIAARTAANAAFITGHQTGSIRFYSGRSTAGWGDIDPGRLDEAVEFLRRHGRKPYLLFEAWEEPLFRSRFRGDRLGELGWPPAAEINQTVRIYDPDDYPRYRRGETISTERVIRRRE